MRSRTILLSASVLAIVIIFCIVFVNKNWDFLNMFQYKPLEQPKKLDIYSYDTEDQLAILNEI